MSAPRETPPVVVVGAGIAGLAAAHRLVEKSRGAGAPSPVVVLEAGDRPGGQIRTEREAGFLFEGGPDTLLAQKPAALDLCERLGLAGEIEGFDPRPSGAEILWRGRLVPVPAGFLMMAPTRLAPLLASSLFSWRGKARMLLEPLIPRRDAGEDDESLESFVVRRFGREVLDRVAEPVIAGLHTADARRLSLRATMPRFLDLEAKDGSVTRGLRRATRAASRAPFGHGTGSRGGAVTLSGGLARLPGALAACLPEGSLRLGARVASIERSGADGAWAVRTEGGDTFRARAVLLACPAFESARLVRRFDPPLAESLETLDYASCATVNLAYRASQLSVRPRSFGFFVPRGENLPILACSYVTEKFRERAPEGWRVMRAFLGGALQPNMLDADDERLVALAHGALREPLGIAGEPEIVRVTRFPRGMPQYHVGATGWIDDVARRIVRHPGLGAAGSVAGAVGIPDCIRSGENAADRLYEAVLGAESAASPAWVAYHANQNA